MHGEHLEYLPKHDPDTIGFLTLIDLLCCENEAAWKAILIHGGDCFLDVVHAELFGAYVWVYAREIEVGHMELEDITQKHTSFHLFKKRVYT